MEFWCLDTLHSIATILGKPLGPSHHTLKCKVLTYACVCFEIDLNQPLPKSIEIRFRNVNWIQYSDYEALPFCCHVCHAYGHLQRNCPKKPFVVSSTTSGSSKNASNIKGKQPVPNDNKDSDGFNPVKSQNKGKTVAKHHPSVGNGVTSNKFDV